MSALIAPGFFSSGPVHTALIVGTAVAVISGPLGVFTVIRGQAFAGEALGDIGTTGGSGRFSPVSDRCGAFSSSMSSPPR